MTMKILYNPFSAVLICCLISLQLPASNARTTHSAGQMGQGSKNRDYGGQMRDGYFRLADAVAGESKAKLVMERLLREFTQFQNDLRYLKMLFSDPNLARDPARSEASFERKGAHENALKTAITNDVVSEGDESDEDMKRLERNYYGWMDFGK